MGTEKEEKVKFSDVPVLHGVVAMFHSLRASVVLVFLVFFVVPL